jgi:hypothetical protein
MPPVVPACAAPTFALGASIPTPGGNAAPAAIAWTGSEAGIFHYDGATVKLDRVTGQGQLVASVDVGAAQAYTISVGVATDGQVYIACWTSGSVPGAFYGVQCASVDIATGAVTPGFSLAGATGGAVAYGAAGFVVAYSTSSTDLQRLGSDAGAIGDPVNVSSFGAQQPPLVVTPGGYALGFVGNVTRVNGALAVVDSTALNGSPNVYGLADSSGTVGIDWLTGGAIAGATLPAGSSSETQFAVSPNASCSSGLMASLAAGRDSFGFTWASGGNAIGYRAFDLTGAALGDAVVSPPYFGAAMCPLPYHTTAAVGDGFLVAVAESSGISLLHLACP